MATVKDRDQKLNPELKTVDFRFSGNSPLILKQIFEKRGRPANFIPTVEKIKLFRKRWIASTQRFAASSAIKEYLRSHEIECDEEDVQIPVRDGAIIAGRLYLPKHCSDDRDASRTPCSVMFHGGGFCLGGLDTEEVLCSIFCSKLGTAVLNVAYRLAPEHPFPAGVHDCIDACIWVRNGDS